AWARKACLRARRARRSRQTCARPCRESVGPPHDLPREPVVAATRRERSRRATRQRDSARRQESEGDKDGKEGRQTGRRRTCGTRGQERTGAHRFLEATLRTYRGDTGGYGARRRAHAAASRTR